ncbi:LPXTG cell wall anchor domain-containing protein [Arthrobacter oryzae]|uniref:LPXTG cell wall anchor domain-containing protein n=1 Tax=Arthrobacter oryzae TaxID=409290 RepID=UPI00273C29FC|nr:LPXTG cell wall anchor domain-containing protein [Arthrobacter oryzae]WLQ07134.1 LPXTG cell wall anchor domain-containing protein [Arthrobacter oryzae]
MKKSLAAIALAGSIALIGAAPSMAATYPAPPANAAVSDGTVGPGEQFIFRGNGFLAGEGLTITVNLGSAPAATGSSVSNGSRTVPTKITLPLAPQTFSTTADANGAFAFPLTISETGTYTLTATGLTSGKTATAVVTVEGTGLANTGGAPLANTGAGLANTGADASLILWSLVGAGALAAGATSVVVVRRRAKADAAA